MIFGTLYLATQPVMNVLAVMFAVMYGIGNASCLLENWSVSVNRYDWPSYVGSSPVLLTWMCFNLLSGSGNVLIGVGIWQPTFAFWHFRHIFTHVLMSVFICGQTNLSINRWMDALALGCNRLCTALNMSLCKDAGTCGRNLPVLMSYDGLFAGGFVIFSRFSEILFSGADLVVAFSLLLWKCIKINGKFQ